MKRKMKLVLALAGLVGVTGAISGTATYAWFTTTRTASVTLTNVGVYGSTSNIKIDYAAITNGVVSNPDSGTKTNSFFNLTGAIYNVTPISGDGATFYMPKWVGGYEGHVSDGDAATVANVASGVHYYVQFGIKITNENVVSTDIYLDYGTAITAGTGGTDAKNIKAAKATRMVFADLGTAAPSAAITTAQLGTTAKYLLGKDTTDTTSTAYYMDAKTDYNSTTTKYGYGEPGSLDGSNGDKYVDFTNSKLYTHNATDWGTGATITAADMATTYYGLNTLPTARINTNGGFGDAALTAKPADNNGANYLCTIAGSGTRYLGVSLWIDGAAADCDNSANGGYVSARINLAAFDVPAVNA